MEIHKRSFYGWYVVCAGFIVSILGTGILSNTLGTFIKPVSDVLSLERAQYSLTMSIAALTSTIALPFWGKFIEIYSLRKLMLIHGILVTIAILSLSLSTSLWQFYLLSVLIGYAGGSVSSLVVSTLISRWFADKRGLALGLASSGSGLGPMLLIPATTTIITRFGWVFAYRFIAGVFLILLIIAIIFIRNRPQDSGLEPYRVKIHQSAGKVQLAGSKKITWTGMTQKEAVRSKCFKYFIVIFLLLGIIYGGTINHLYAYLTDLGYSNSFASLVISLQMAFILLGKATLGMALDKFGIKFGITAALIAFIMAFVCLNNAQIQGIAVIYPMFGGFGIATIVVGSAYITGHYFGVTGYGKILSLFMSAQSFGATIGTYFSGFIFDKTGSYQSAWIIYAIIAFIALASYLKGDALFMKNDIKAEPVILTDV